jgi:hypothetical protein
MAFIASYLRDPDLPIAASAAKIASTSSFKPSGKALP